MFDAFFYSHPGCHYNFKKVFPFGLQDTLLKYLSSYRKVKEKSD